MSLEFASFYSIGSFEICNLAKDSLKKASVPISFENAMSRFRIFVLLSATTVASIVGCGPGKPTVIQPRTYELTEQEQANRERAERALAQQRQ
jgi:hypothetical protein